MFKINDNKVNLGKSESPDFGSDKNKKQIDKTLIKNSNLSNSNNFQLFDNASQQTNADIINNFKEINLNIDSNKVAAHLILELSNKKSELEKRLLNLRRNCVNCNRNSIETAEKKLKELAELQKKYNFEKQFLSNNPVIVRVDSQINRLNQEIEGAKLMYGVEFCKKHTDLKYELMEKQLEIKNLQETMKLCLNQK